MLVLLVPIVPFVVFGHWLEPLIESVVADEISEGNSILAAVGIIIGLTVDILLPVPSSVLLTFGGRYFGVWGGALIGWVGLNLSAALGFWLSRSIGRQVLERFSSDEDLESYRLVDDRLGVWSLVACRALPILAEASVLFAGLSQMSSRKFWPAVIGSNAIIALSYAWLGDYASQRHWFATAILISMFIPLLFIVGFRLWQRRGIAKRGTQLRSKD